MTFFRATSHAVSGHDDMPRRSLAIWLWPTQVTVKKLECPLAIDDMSTVKELDLCLLWNAQLSVQPADLRVFVGNPSPKLGDTPIADASGRSSRHVDYRKMYKFHKSRESDATLACVPLSIKECRQMGVMEVDESYRIVGFQEKVARPKPLPSDPSKALASMGVYIFNADLLSHLYDTLSAVN